MPAPSTIEEFLDLVKKSGVVEEKRMAAHLERNRAAGTLPSDPLGLATQLVQEGVLTHFQAEQFLQGKWKRFMIGKYKVLERLGAGGMGSVYLCEHTLMRRRVALKVLPAARCKDTSSLDRFYREARAVAALDHPNIVRAYDIDQEDAFHFLVMEHVDGASLQEMVKRAGEGMDPVRAAHYIYQSALGLQHAHDAAGLVHRDIKPGNILVDRNGVVKVLDMGLARFYHDEEDPLTKKFDENVLGTADYLAPEQALDSHTVDIRADIYSLGGTFYYCLTGKTPFSEGSVAQKLIWHQTRQPKPIKSVRPDVPDEIAAIVERMMAKDPAQRYQTPREVAEALAPWTQTPIAPPPEREMPQLSLAATRALNATGDSSMTGARSPDSASRSAARWKVTGNSSAPLKIPAAETVVSRPATPTPVAAPPVAPPPARPAAGPASAPMKLELPPSRPPAPPPPPPVTRPAPAPAPAAPTQAMPAVVALPELQPIEEVEEEMAFQPTVTTPREPRTPRRAEPAKTSALLIGLGVGIFLVAAALGLVIYLVVFSPKPQKPKEERPPIRITPANAGGLTQALRNCRDGDRIIIETDLTEADVFVTKANLTIEGAEGKAITWRAPAGADQQAKLLNITGATGLTVKNLTLDGSGRAMALVQVYGKCDSLRLENLTLKGLGQFGLLFANADGEKDKPMTVAGVRIETSQPAQHAVRFLPGKHATIQRTSNLILRDLTISGPGRKVTQLNAACTDPAGIELPMGLKVEIAQK
jgi:serine/threonine protein kinase